LDVLKISTLAGQPDYFFYTSWIGEPSDYNWMKLGVRPPRALIDAALPMSTNQRIPLRNERRQIQASSKAAGPHSLLSLK